MEYPQSRAVVPALVVTGALGSTNTELRDLARREDLEWFTTLVSEEQTAGRGRLDRAWATPPGGGLAISVLLPTPGPEGSWIPLVAGLAMADALDPVVSGVAVKWPNDVLIGERKICGILAERSAEGVVLGAGVNTRMRREELPVPTATSLALEGVAVDGQLLDGVLARFLASLRAALDAGIPGEVRDRVRARCATIGRPVRAEIADEVVVGVAVGLDDSGWLRVRTPDGSERLIAAGDVVHLRVTG